MLLRLLQATKQCQGNGAYSNLHGSRSHFPIVPPSLWSFWFVPSATRLYRHPVITKSVFGIFYQNCTHMKRTVLYQAYRVLPKDDFTVLSTQFARQLKGLVVHRVRRSVQMIQLYRDLGYDMQYIRTLFRNIGTRMLKLKEESKFFTLLAAVAFNWKEQRITEDEVTQVESEMDFVNKIKGSTDKTEKLEKHFEDGWEIVFKRPNLIAWRQPVEGSSFYKYKLYGSIEDIPARAFYHAQIDMDYRKQWDKIVIDLDVIDEDPDTNNQVVHWTMNFPYPMYPREYVYIRKHKVDYQKNLMYTMSHSCLHPNVPVTSKFVRVETYISNMVIRPYTTFDENGFDYILTYYDEPKSNFPTFAYNWMASTGVPDFVEKMYNAARHLRQHGKRLPNYKNSTSCRDKERQQSSQGQAVL